MKHGEGSGIARSAAADNPSPDLDVAMEQEMIDLYQYVNALLPDSPKRVLQFIASRSGEGVSTIVRQFAVMATARLGKSVLILDANQGESNQRHFFRIMNNCGWDEAVIAPEAMNRAICRIGNSNLYVSGLSRHTVAVPLLFDACQLENLFMSLKMQFDLVLIDSSPVTTGMDSLMLSRCADGVVLVLEAEKTRWPVVRNMVAKIRKSGGNILGLVFNKRRYYIPEYLYRRL